jgi:hypothetical protein
MSEWKHSGAFIITSFTRPLLTQNRSMIKWMNVSRKVSADKSFNKEKLTRLSQSKFFRQRTLDQLFSSVDNPEVTSYITHKDNKMEFAHNGFVTLFNSG